MYRQSYRKPDFLMLLNVFVLLAAMLTTVMGGDRSLPTSRFVSDLQDGDIQILHLGKRGPGVHLSLQSPQRVRDASPGEVGSQRTTTTPDLYLNLRYPW